MLPIGCECSFVDGNMTRRADDERFALHGNHALYPERGFRATLPAPFEVREFANIAGASDRDAAGTTLTNQHQGHGAPIVQAQADAGAEDYKSSREIDHDEQWGK